MTRSLPVLETNNALNTSWPKASCTGLGVNVSGMGMSVPCADFPKYGDSNDLYAVVQ